MFYFVPLCYLLYNNVHYNQFCLSYVTTGLCRGNLKSKAHITDRFSKLKKDIRGVEVHKGGHNQLFVIAVISY